ncbi:VWA domain-containing protein [Armatimonas sp.]|uniref:vWA domain-containing protein n=1 Tax=Armatimonas sp. TaxID=1872638 RepID=UPI0037524C9D
MDQTIRVNPTVMGGDPNRTQMAQPTVMGYPGSPNLGGGGGGPSLALNVRVSNRYAFAGDRTRAHVLTQISAGGAGGFVPGGKRLPVNVCLVIDRSGSMDGSPIQYVKKACEHVVDLLTPDDVLSIVTFEESVEVLMPARRVTDTNLIKQHIQRIVAGTTTNLFDGLYAGGAQVASVPMAGYVTRVLLLTDGEPTAGLKDFGSIVQQVADLKARGITVTALGFGPEYNEELMAGIARRSGGNYYYIERPEQIPEVFQKEMLTILGVTAKNIRLTFTLPRGVTVRQCYGSPPELGARHAAITLPDIERGATVTKLWEVDYDPHAVASFRTAKIILSWDDGATGQRETLTANAVVEFTADAARVPSGADPLVAQELSSMQAARDLEKTMMGMRTQQLNLADLTAALNKTQQMFTQQGNTEAAKTVQMATQAAQRGDTGGAEKTLIGTIYSLDLGKRS